MPRFRRGFLTLCAFWLLWATGTTAEPIRRTDAPRTTAGQYQWWDQLQEADALVNQGDYSRATVDLQSLLNQVPPPVRAMIHLRLASIFANQEDWPKAVQNGKKAIQSAPSNGWVYLPVAKILHAAGKDDEAIATCRQAVKVDPAVKDAARDLINELGNDGTRQGILLFGVGLFAILALSGGSILFYRRRKKSPEREKDIPIESEHSLPNYYPITGHAYNPGDLVGHYRILSVVGSTLHSILYCAEDTHLDRQVALKQVNPGIGVHGDAPTKRFQKEVKSLIALSNHHAGVVKVYDFIEPGLLVMEWVDGSTLDSAWEYLAADRVLEIGIELCNILYFAHSMAIVHRDIKPSNIMLTNQTRQIRLLDFGIAKNATLGTSSLTLDGSVPIGTFAYMPPEQFAAPNQAQQAADIYSLGLTLYRVLTGEMPTDPWFGPRTFSLTPESEFKKITSESHGVKKFLSKHDSLENPWIDELDEALRKAFRENPRERYGDAREFGDRLKGIWHRIGNIPQTGELKKD